MRLTLFYLLVIPITATLWWEPTGSNDILGQGFVAHVPLPLKPTTIRLGTCKLPIPAGVFAVTMKGCDLPLHLDASWCKANTWSFDMWIRVHDPGSVLRLAWGDSNIVVGADRTGAWLRVDGGTAHKATCDMSTWSNVKLSLLANRALVLSVCNSGSNVRVPGFSPSDTGSVSASLASDGHVDACLTAEWDQNGQYSLTQAEFEHSTQHWLDRPFCYASWARLASDRTVFRTTPDEFEARLPISLLQLATCSQHSLVPTRRFALLMQNTSASIFFNEATVHGVAVVEFTEPATNLTLSTRANNTLAITYAHTTILCSDGTCKGNAAAVFDGRIYLPSLIDTHIDENGQDTKENTTTTSTANPDTVFFFWFDTIV